MRAFLWEFFLFGLKQARACIFAGGFFALLLATRLESWEEALVLCAFHAVGLALELFKTHPAIASWGYPEAGYLKLGTVPLYSGFMYAAVASYMCQAWRLLRLELDDYPRYRVSVPLAAAVYLNFFTHHFLPDARWLLIGLVFFAFRRTRVHYVVAGPRRTMPLVLSFALIGFFVWVAENVSTYLGAWVYPEQRTAWQLVSWRIISSWFLLVIVSFIIVADLKHVRGERSGRQLRHGIRDSDLARQVVYRPRGRAVIIEARKSGVVAAPPRAET